MKYFIITILILLTGCNSVYKEREVQGLSHVSIKKYENYYEVNPLSQIIINNPEDLKKIEKFLKWLPGTGSSFKDFHDFTDSKIILELFSGDKSFEMRIINGRLEVKKNMYYNILLPIEKNFISLIEKL